MVHDGDQNKTGGDVGQDCVFFVMPGAAPTATPSPTATATATATPPAVIAATSKTFSGKTVIVTFQNNTATGQLLTGLSMTWPQATNHNLTKITMGATTIYNTSTGNGTLTTSLLTGTNAQRTIAAGSCATLTFTFQNNVSTNPSNYTGSATFSPFGPVTYLP
jgi:hypothetical protein